MIKNIREHHPYIPIIVFSAYDDKEYLLQALEYGIAGYILDDEFGPLFGDQFQIFPTPGDTSIPHIFMSTVNTPFLHQKLVHEPHLVELPPFHPCLRVHILIFSH